MRADSASREDEQKQRKQRKLRRRVLVVGMSGIAGLVKRTMGCERALQHEEKERKK